MKLIKPVMHAEFSLTLHTGSLELSCINYWVLGHVFYQGHFPKIAHFVDSGNSPGRSKVLLLIFQIYVLLRSCL